MVTHMHTQVLIIGAGPTGLACAITLASLGVQVTIVDALAEVKPGARAALVHARTLEVLDTIGVTSRLLKLGIHSKGVVFHSGSTKLMEVDITLLQGETRFPITLLLPQDEIERVFLDRLAELGIKVLRNRRVIDMKETCHNDGLDVNFDDGTVIASRYVVGADGSRSIIRRLAGIDFEDPHTGVSYDKSISPGSPVLQIVFSDMFLEEPLPKSISRDTVSWYLDKRLLFCPLPLPRSEKLNTIMKAVSFWRIGMVVPSDSLPPPRYPSAQYFQQEIDARHPWGDRITIASVMNGATYRVRSAVASQFYKKLGGGNVLLVGDAAHVHPPSGGQGMNLGLCDAVTLGRALVAHIRRNSNSGSGLEDDLALVNYSITRRQAAVETIGAVKKLTALITAATGWKQNLRNVLLWIAGSLPFVRRTAAWRLSGLAHRDS